MRAKFVLQEKHQFAHAEGEQLVFTPVRCSSIPEDAQFHKYTPSGKLEMFVTNPNVLAKMELGKSYYVDFTPAE